MTKKLVTSAVLLGLATVLSFVKLFDAPFGGSVTAASMVPVIMIGLIYDKRWAIISAITYSVLQFIFATSVPPVQDFVSYAQLIVIDYLLAFGVLGLSGVFFDMLGRKNWAIPVSAGIVVLLRFICHFVSGVIIWGIYAPEGQNVFLYSFLYNGGYMLCELIITVIIISALSRVIALANK